MNSYVKALSDAMSMLAENGYVFVGQAVRYSGTSMFQTLEHIPEKQRWEFPVMESCQLGFSAGASIAGAKICSVFPRINFLLEATGQLVSHLDKLPLYSDYKPKVLIRTAIPTPEPLNPGPQHLDLGDYSRALDRMLSTVAVVWLDDAKNIVPCYENALERETSTILIEYTSMYGDS